MKGLWDEAFRVPLLWGISSGDDPWGRKKAVSKFRYEKEGCYPFLNYDKKCLLHRENVVCMLDGGMK